MHIKLFIAIGDSLSFFRGRAETFPMMNMHVVWYVYVKFTSKNLQNTNMREKVKPFKFIFPYLYCKSLSASLLWGSTPLRLSQCYNYTIFPLEYEREFQENQHM